jgi:hypothetical protein
MKISINLRPHMVALSRQSETIRNMKNIFLLCDPKSFAKRGDDAWIFNPFPRHFSHDASFEYKFGHGG